MATITLQRLKQLIENAYEAGYTGSLELAESYVEDTISSIVNDTPSSPNLNDGWRKYSLSELVSLPVGTIIEHYNKGKGWVDQIERSYRGVRFENGTYSIFKCEGDPWTDPMRIIGNIVKPKPKKTRRFNEEYTGFPN